MYALALRMSCTVVSFRKEWMSSPNLRYLSTPPLGEGVQLGQGVQRPAPLPLTMSTMMEALSFRSIFTRSEALMFGFTLR